MSLLTEMDGSPNQRGIEDNTSTSSSSKLIEFNQSDIGGVGNFDIHSLLADSIIPLQTSGRIGSSDNNKETQKLVIETIREEVATLRIEISEMALNIKTYESSDIFNAEDARYKRWVATKRVLQANVHELLVSMAGSLHNEGGAVVSRQEKTVRNVLDFLDTSSTGSAGGSLANWDGSSIGGDSRAKDVIKMSGAEIESELNSTEGLQLNAYKYMKEELSQIMRDFSVNSIHFKSKEDSSNVFVRQFQLIKNSGEKIEDALQGTLYTFRIGINKKTKEYSSARLFIPFYEETTSGHMKL